MKPYTVITGASSGLGKSLAVACAKQARNLILLSMPQSGLPQLSAQLQQVYGINVKHYECNLLNVDDLNSALEEITHEDINCLINNVGIGGSGNFLSSTLKNLFLMIDLNLKSTVTLTYSILPNLLKHKHPQLINVSSIAGVAPVAYKTIYPACKSFIKTLSYSLNEEFRERGLIVSTVFPGPMVTNTNTTERIVKQGLKARLSLCSTSEVAGYVLEKAAAGARQIVPGWFNHLQYRIATFFPQEWVAKWISKTIKKELA